MGCICWAIVQYTSYFCILIRFMCICTILTKPRNKFSLTSNSTLHGCKNALPNETWLEKKKAHERAKRYSRMPTRVSGVLNGPVLPYKIFPLANAVCSQPPLSRLRLPLFIFFKKMAEVKKSKTPKEFASSYHFHSCVRVVWRAITTFFQLVFVMLTWHFQTCSRLPYGWCLCGMSCVAGEFPSCTDCYRV